MTYNPDIHHRRSIRLKGYDYNQEGLYFITICTQGKKCMFGEIVDYEMRLNEAGQIVASTWNTLPQRFPGIELDAYIIMPNHLHGIIANLEASPNTRFAASTNPLSSHLSTLGQIIRTFKAASSHRIRSSGRRDFAWQRDYHDHIIRNNKALDLIHQYILNNPAQWAEDSLNTLNTKEGSLV